MSSGIIGIRVIRQLSRGCSCKCHANVTCSPQASGSHFFVFFFPRGDIFSNKSLLFGQTHFHYCCLDNASLYQNCKNMYVFVQRLVLIIEDFSLHCYTSSKRFHCKLHLCCWLVRSLLVQNRKNKGLGTTIHTFITYQGLTFLIQNFANSNIYYKLWCHNTFYDP